MKIYLIYQFHLLCLNIHLHIHNLVIDILSLLRHHLNLKNIKLQDLKNEFHNIKENKKLIVFCQSGKRRLSAVKILNQMGFTDVLHLDGGVNSLKKNNL